MTASTLTRRRPLVQHDPLLNKSYQDTALGPAIVDFLAWLEVGEKSPRTLDTYERALARGALMYPAHGLGELGDGELLQIATSFSAKQRAKRMAAYKSMYRWALRSRRVERNPCDALPDFKPPGKRVYDVFSEEEIGLLCDLPVRDGALMQLMFDEGLRKGECRALRLRHLRVTAAGRCEVVVLGGKGDKDRTLPASATVVQKVNELALLDGLEPRDHLWYSSVGHSGQIRRRWFDEQGGERDLGETVFVRWWERSLIAAGVRYRNPHMTRHTFATRYLRRGGTLERLSMAMGHVSIATTFNLYAHLDTTDLVDEFERVFAITAVNQSAEEE